MKIKDSTVNHQEEGSRPSRAAIVSVETLSATTCFADMIARYQEPKAEATIKSQIIPAIMTLKYALG
jgi:hypothetical protein